MFFKNILVLAPHTDDGELGAGGFITKSINLGAKVSYIAFSSCEKSVPQGYTKDTFKKEVKRATQVLGINSGKLKILDYEVREFTYKRQEILEDLINIRNSDSFDLVLTPSLNDIHQDHAVIAYESMRAFKTSASILSYDLPWNNTIFQSHCFIKLSSQEAENKFNALTEYKSLSDKPYMQKDAVFSLMRHKGMQCSSEFAESFEVIRWFID